MKCKTVYAALMPIQQKLKAPKNREGKGDDGRYHYRSAEDILERVKPLLQEQGLILYMNDEIIADAAGSYVKSTVTIVDIATGDNLQTHAVAREDTRTNFMSPGQATGACSSYARKYALCGLFAIDDSKDLDDIEYQREVSRDRDVRANALKDLKRKVKQLNCSWDEVKEVAASKFSKDDTKSLRSDEIIELTKNLSNWLPK